MNQYRIPEVAKKYTDYDIIQVHTELPRFPDTRTRLLFAFLKSSPRSAESSELYALATSLAQMGLDTHELVSECSPLENKAIRSRQLKVLAGDYFSSRFYHLLAQAGQIELTRQLSQAICEVNRLKMNLYHSIRQLKLTSEDYMKQTVSIRMTLFLIFGRWMDEKQSVVWPELLQRLTACEVIAEEIDKSEAGAPEPGSWAYLHIMEHATREEKKHVQTRNAEEGKIRAILLKYQVKRQLFQLLDSHVEALQEMFKRFDPDKYVGELAVLLEPFTRYLAAPKVIEER